MAKNNELAKPCPTCKGTGQVPGPGRLANLKAAREAAGVSQEQVALTMGISRAYLRDIEAGARGLSEMLAVKYETALEELAGEQQAGR